MLTAVLREAHQRQIQIGVKPAGIMKRGVCTFPTKARSLAASKGGLGILINTGV